MDLNTRQSDQVILLGQLSDFCTFSYFVLSWSDSPNKKHSISFLDNLSLAANILGAKSDMTLVEWRIGIMVFTYCPLFHIESVFNRAQSPLGQNPCGGSNYFLNRSQPILFFFLTATFISTSLASLNSESLGVFYSVNQISSHFLPHQLRLWLPKSESLFTSYLPIF